MSRTYTSSPPSASMACSGTALLYQQSDLVANQEELAKDIMNLAKQNICFIPRRDLQHAVGPTALLPL
jgi:hypothetical protein